MVDADDVRRYDETQFALILRKAAESQARETARPMGTGLSLSEIEGIAAEAGIEPRFVRQAVTAVAGERRGAIARIVGFPFRFDAQHVVQGELPHGTLSTMVDALQTAHGRPGTAREVLGGVEWKARDTWGTTHASVRRTGAETRIHISADRSETAAVLITLAPFAGLAAGGILASVVDASAGLATAAITINGGLAGLAAARAVWSGVARRWRQRVDVLLDRSLLAIRSAPPSPERIAHATTDPPQGMTPTT